MIKTQEYILDVLRLYDEHGNAYKVARLLKDNKNKISSIISKYRPNKSDINIDLERKVAEQILLHPYTGSINKISKILNITSFKLRQLILKTDKEEIKSHFDRKFYTSHKLSDTDIHKILLGSYEGIGHDKMAEMMKIDSVSVRSIRKLFLTEEEYELYHNISKFYEGNYRAFYNDRGDKFLSSLEERLADILYFNNIKYKSNVTLDYQNKKYSPDFYLDDYNIFVEIFGMSNVNCYKIRMKEKINYYNKYDILCLFLYEEDFHQDDTYILNKITYFLNTLKHKNEHICINF